MGVGNEGVGLKAKGGGGFQTAGWVPNGGASLSLCQRWRDSGRGEGGGGGGGGGDSGGDGDDDSRW